MHRSPNQHSRNQKSMLPENCVLFARNIIANGIKTMLCPVIRFTKYRVLHIDDSPHRIAMGVAIGLFTAWLPPLWFHIIFVLIVAAILRANKFVALTFIWASNPFTFIPIYYPNYLLGRAILGWLRNGQRLGASDIAAMFENFTFSKILTGIHTAEFWSQLGSLTVQVGFEMTVGGVIIGSCLALISYFATSKLVRWYRTKHPHRHIQNGLKDDPLPAEQQTPPKIQAKV